VVWLFVGMLVGLVNVLLLLRTVAHVRLNVPRHVVRWDVLRGIILRLALVAVVLSLALQRSLISALLAFVGFWLSRWAAVYLGKSGRIAWVWFIDS
jgi:hypothetical protein